MKLMTKTKNILDNNRFSFGSNDFFPIAEFESSEIGELKISKIGIVTKSFYQADRKG